MASEDSRELSAKVFAGQCPLIELGFRQGGPAIAIAGAPLHQSLEELRFFSIKQFTRDFLN